MPGDAPGTSITVGLTCSLLNYAAVPSLLKSFTLSFSLDCRTGNVMNKPNLPPVSIDQTYIATTIPAFGDAVSGSSNPPTCGARTCSSNNHPNVAWNNAS